MITPIPRSPAEFDGSVAAFFTEHAEHVLPSVGSVVLFHRRLSEYLQSEDPIFLVRMVRGLERARTVRVQSGARLRATDNAPAWWIHRALFCDDAWEHEAFARFIDGVPCHMFALPRGDHVSAAGWHVAHIFDAKNRDVGFANWSRAELSRRMVRNIHPCNYFYIPKAEWQRHGADRSVIGYFANQFALRYHTVWQEFLGLADASMPTYTASFGGLHFSYGRTRERTREVRSALEVLRPSTEGCSVRYEFGRLCFKASVIEPLQMDDRFCVVTPAGTYSFSKREFYEVFPGVVASASYRERGIYHFPSPPKRALRFLVPSS